MIKITSRAKQQLNNLIDKQGKSALLYLQPEWSKSEVLLPLILSFLQDNPEWRLSLQTHKFLNIP